MAEPDDPKQNVNARMQDRAIRHAIYLERYYATATQQVVGYLNEEVYPDLLEKAGYTIGLTGKGAIVFSF